MIFHTRNPPDPHFKPAHSMLTHQSDFILNIIQEFHCFFHPFIVMYVSIFNSFGGLISKWIRGKQLTWQNNMGIAVCSFFSFYYIDVFCSDLYIIKCLFNPCYFVWRSNNGIFSLLLLLYPVHKILHYLPLRLLCKKWKLHGPWSGTWC